MNSNENSEKKFLPEGNIVIFVFFVIFQAIFLFIIVMAFRGTVEDEVVSAEVNIDNIQATIGDESSNEIDETLETLAYNIISENIDDLENIDQLGSSVREGSVIKKNFDDNPSVRYISFIVDFFDIKQSYRFYYEYEDLEEPDMWGNNVIDLFVSCVSDEEVVFDDFDCNNFNEVDRRVGLVKNNLKYINSEDYYAYINDNDSSQIRIVSRYYEYTGEQSTKYIEEVRQFVESLGISPDLFNYYMVPVSELEIL